MQQRRRTTLYDAVENGVADVVDPMLKDRIAEQARADVERAAGALDRLGPRAGGYRCDHLRALAQRDEVGAKGVRIMGSKGVLPCALVAASNAKAAGFGVTRFVPNWPAG